MSKEPVNKVTHPLGEVFGFPPDDFSKEAKRHRKLRLCPFGNKVPSCTKDKANDPLGVCTIVDSQSGDLAITCPIRFRESWLIAENAAEFFFPPNTNWTSLAEVRLNDKHGKSAGNIDLVLVSYDENGQVLDFGALEVQAVYISGNIRRPYQAYIESPKSMQSMDWTGKSNYPRADYLSSSRKRLVPQLIYKGRILREWGKKMAVAIHSGFFDTLPALALSLPTEAEIAWLIYDLTEDTTLNRYRLVNSDSIYTLFQPALDAITIPEAGSLGDFMSLLQDKLNEKLDSNPPDAPTLTDIVDDE
ncbi:MAG: NotI family restriction endonuclease [bacterium]|nr:NotI family restriction endonuclease [bacterium]